MSDTTDSSSAISSSASASSGGDIYDEQLYFVLKQFLVTKDGISIADVLNELNKNLATIAAKLPSPNPAR